MPEALRPVFLRAPAKINLTLDVLGKRADGYHELASVMQTIALYDTIALWPATGDEIRLDCNVPALNVPDNLVVRAAHLARSAKDNLPNVRIELVKGIPSPGGLGGGSSDGATVLRALNAWWQLGLSPAQLTEIAATLGSDVPYFIHGGTALIAGRGERVTPLPDILPLWLIVAQPPVHVPTPAVFRALDSADYSDSTATRTLVNAIQSGAPLDLADATFFNALQAGVLRDYPAVNTVREQLLASGAPVVRMSGSGPALYAPFRTLAKALPVWQAVQATGMRAWLTHTINRSASAME